MFDDKRLKRALMFLEKEELVSLLLQFKQINQAHCNLLAEYIVKYAKDKHGSQDTNQG